MVSRIIYILTLFFFTLNARADVVNSYNAGDFDKVHSELLRLKIKGMDNSAIETHLKITLDVFAQSPQYNISELISIVKHLSRSKVNNYLSKYFQALLKTFEDRKLMANKLKKEQIEKTLKELAAKKSDVLKIDHEKNAQLDFLALRSYRTYLTSKDSDFLFYTGWARALRGQGTYHLEKYLEDSKSSKFKRQAEEILKKE